MQKEKTQKCSGSQFKFSQVFGYKSANDHIQEEDIISVLKFDQSGRYLALGDHAGRVIVFEAPDGKKKTDGYDYCTEVTIIVKQFQAHVR